MKLEALIAAAAAALVYFSRRTQIANTPAAPVAYFEEAPAGGVAPLPPTDMDSRPIAADVATLTTLQRPGQELGGGGGRDPGQRTGYNAPAVKGTFGYGAAVAAKSLADATPLGMLAGMLGYGRQNNAPRRGFFGMLADGATALTGINFSGFTSMAEKSDNEGGEGGRGIGGGASRGDSSAEGGPGNSAGNAGW